MAKWFGKIGFDDPEEVSPGVWSGTKARQYYGDLTRNYGVIHDSENGLNSTISLNNQISIVADPYAKTHIYSMRWVEFQGAKWKITNVEVSRPRLILTIGGLYNENET